MSAEKWESLTWDWIEREIVDYLLIANRKPEKSHGNSLARLIPARPAATCATQRRSGTKRRSSSNA